jgi:hypothetical protein
MGHPLSSFRLCIDKHRIDFAKDGPTPALAHDSECIARSILGAGGGIVETPR